MNFDFIHPYDYFEELRYILEVLAAEFLLTIPTPLKRREFFWQKLVAGTLFLCGFSYLLFVIRAGINLVPEAFENRWMVRIVYIPWYCLLIFLTTLFLKILFDAPFVTLVSRSLIAWCCQHMEFVFANEIIGLGIAPWMREDYLFCYILLSVATCALLYFLLYRYFIPLLRIENIDTLPKKTVWAFFFAFVILLVSTFFHQEIFNDYIENKPDGAYFSATVDFFSCFLILVSMYMIYRLLKVNKEKIEAQKLLAEREKQFEQSKEAIAIINRKSHDLKHQIRALQEMSSEDQQKAFCDVEKSLTIYDSSFHTGNEVLDTILTEKALVAEKNHIRITSIIDGKLLSFIDKMDLYVLFGNALDNAIEACEKLSSDQDKVISIHISKEQGMCSIQIENTFDGKLYGEGEDLLTSKQNKAYHGYGYASIKEIAKKYGGVAVHEAKANLFVLHILLPVKK